MSRFDTYFLMKTPDVLEYVKEKGYMPTDADLTAKEIGDGNLNYVYRVVDNKSGKSVIVKQAGVSLRISAEMKVSTDRNRIESEILQIQWKYAPGLVPQIFGYDTVMSACVMEDLSDHALMRYALMRHETFPPLRGRRFHLHGQHPAQNHGRRHGAQGQKGHGQALH